ncbi:MAG: sulfatase-like hydrolase/transferase [Planctomycetota bacterium]
MRQRRNLLIVLAHGLRSDALSDEREWPLPTPHMVELAGRGVRLVLTSASPADPGGMASLLTGLHARQHGQLRDDDTAAVPPLRDGLPAWLSDAGYHTVGVGEVGSFAGMLDESFITEGVAHLDPAPHRCWYTAAARARGHASALVQQRRQRRRTGPLAPDRLLLEPDEDIDGFIAAQGYEALGRMPDNKPWALFVVFSGPGNDLPPPMYYDGVVETAGLAKNFVPAKLDRLDALTDPELPRAVLQRLEAHQIARIRADYLGRVSLIDHGLGRLNEALAARDDAARNWTVLTSDRGQLLGEHGLIGHRSFLAAALEVPMIISPTPEGQKRNVRAAARPTKAFPDGLFGVADVAPTVAHLGGVDTPERLAGRSLLPLFHGEPALPTPAANLSEFHDRLLVETERFKAVFRTTDRRCLGLYDLVSDPEERVNLVARRGAGDRKEIDRRVQAMRLRLADALMPLRG